MFQVFIRRTVLSTVISILLLILGIIGLTSLPVEQYPDIAPPTVRVTATYIGASAETVLKSVIIPLEESINGVEGMTYMTSVAANDGTATINVFFDISVNPDIATVNVQNKVAKATSLLPSIVIQTGVTTAKIQNSALMFIALYSDNADYDDIFIQNYARINIVPELQRIKGVGDVTVWGSKEYSMRVWLDPHKMANYNIMPSDIQNALREQNVEVPVGKFGENSTSVLEYTLKYKGRLFKTEDYENIIVKSLGKGKYLRLRDVANISLGGYNYSNKHNAMGKPSIAFGIFQTAGSDATAIVLEAEKVLKKAEKSFPNGFHFIVPYSSNDFLFASIEKVVHTLVEAFILGFIVVFIFLQSFRSTLIPVISVPVSIIGTFFFLKVFGYTINMLTLFAIILSIGIVVDDAIVVVEAVFAKLEAGYKSSREAAFKAMEEISGAIISITLVLVAVFVPTMFIAGSSGKFYKQFAITLAIAVVISAVNALTLSPALCAIFLKPQDDHEGKRGKKATLSQRFFIAFNTGFEALTLRYTRALKFLAHKKWIPISILLLSVSVALFFFRQTPTGFIPNEDMGRIFGDIALAPGSSLYETSKVVDKVDSIIAQYDIVKERMNIMGSSILNAITGPSYAFSVVKLKDWSLRKDPKSSVDSVIKQFYAKTASIKNARFVFFTPPTVRGFGNSSGFEFKLLDKGDDSWVQIDKVSKEFIQALMKRPEIGFVSTSYNAYFPEYELSVNVEKVKDAGLNLTDIFNTLQGYYAGLYTTDFNRFGKQYKVMIQASPEYRIDQTSLRNVYVTNKEGQSVSIDEFVRVDRVYAPEIITRYNLYKAVNLTGAPKPGYSTGDAIRAIEEEAANVLPTTYTYEFTGLSREEVISGGQSLGIFALSLIFVYFILAALYESYILPLAVIFSLVIGVMGAIGFVHLLGLENNIYFQVALIMLLGLLAKNAILIVEFALQKRQHENMSLYDAALEGAKVRLRPILMTSFAFILGVAPLAFAKGVGAVGNRSIGTGAMGGLLVGTFVGIFIIPTLFVIFQNIQEKWFGKQNV